MLTVGRICVKIAGRDAGKKCVIVDVNEKKHRILIDGATRRREVNPLHLEPLKLTVEIAKGASSAEVKKALEPLGIEVVETKPKTAAEKPKRTRKQKAKPEPKKKKAAKKETKKEEKKTEKPKEEKKVEKSTEQK